MRSARVRNGNCVPQFRLHLFIRRVREAPVVTSDRMTGKIIARIQRIKPTIRLSFVARKWHCTPDALGKDVTSSLSQTSRRDNLFWLFVPTGISRARAVVITNDTCVYSDVNASRSYSSDLSGYNIWDPWPSPARRSFTRWHDLRIYLPSTSVR